MRTIDMNPLPDVWEKFQALPNDQLYRAIGYLTQWGTQPHNADTVSRVVLSFLDQNGLEIHASYKLSETRGFYIAAIWSESSQSFSFHS